MPDPKDKDTPQVRPTREELIDLISKSTRYRGRSPGWDQTPFDIDQPLPEVADPPMFRKHPVMINPQVREAYEQFIRDFPESAGGINRIVTSPTRTVIGRMIMSKLNPLDYQDTNLLGMSRMQLDPGDIYINPQHGYFSGIGTIVNGIVGDSQRRRQGVATVDRSQVGIDELAAVIAHEIAHARGAWESEADATDRRYSDLVKGNYSKDIELPPDPRNRFLQKLGPWTQVK